MRKLKILSISVWYIKKRQQIKFVTLYETLFNTNKSQNQQKGSFWKKKKTVIQHRTKRQNQFYLQEHLWKELEKMNRTGELEKLKKLEKLEKLENKDEVSISSVKIKK